MLTLYRLLGLRHLRSKFFRSAMTTLGVLLGVALFVAIGIVNASVLGSFRENMASLSGKAALTVSAGEVGFPEERVEELRKAPGVRDAIPRVEAWGYLAGDRTASETLFILG